MKALTATALMLLSVAALSAQSPPIDTGCTATIRIVTYLRLKGIAPPSSQP